MNKITEKMLERAHAGVIFGTLGALGGFRASFPVGTIGALVSAGFYDSSLQEAIRTALLISGGLCVGGTTGMALVAATSDPDTLMYDDALSSKSVAGWLIGAATGTVLALNFFNAADPKPPALPATEPTAIEYIAPAPSFE